MATPWGGGPFLEEDAQGFAKLVVRTHPGSGRKSLYLASHASHIIGWPVEKGRGSSRTRRPYRFDNPLAKIKGMTIPQNAPPMPLATTSWGNRESAIPIRVNPDVF